MRISLLFVWSLFPFASYTLAQLPLQKLVKESDTQAERPPPASPLVSPTFSAAEERATALQSKQLSLRITQDQRRSDKPLPPFCKPVPERKAGPWHLLADDEYNNDSPYLLCGLPESDARQSARRLASQRSIKGVSGSRTCAEVLQIPKVAMMFLTQGPMHHEAMWGRWLASVSGLIPTLCAANAVCARGGMPALTNISRACGEQSSWSKSIYERQFLFSVFIHAPPEYPPRGKGSVFFGRDTVVPRLHSAWADHSTVEAVRRMLHAALRDRANQRFILLSESCIPLYSPLVVYQQLMHEKRSRISACANPGWDRSLERYNIRMAVGRREYGRIPVERWRKHMHWFSLTRFHAELVSNDTDIVETFARDCFIGFDILCTDPSKYRFCMADEHYISTLLAVYGLDAQTDCMGHLTHASFDKDGDHPEHPKRYTASEINATLIWQLREGRDEAVAAAFLAKRSFHKAEEFAGNSSIWNIPYPKIRQLTPQYYLFARKFGADTATAVLDLFEGDSKYDDQLGILGNNMNDDRTSESITQ